MPNTNSLSNIEGQVFKIAIFEDGLWEIYLGLFFGLMSIYSITRTYLGPVINAILFLGVTIGIVGLVWLIKKTIVVPRLGLVKFGPRTRKKINIAHGITWLLVLGTISLVVFASMGLLKEPGWDNLPQWLGDFYIDLIFALVMVILFCVVAYLVALPRFYLYGVILGVAQFVSAVMFVYQGKLFQWPLALSGGLIVISGASVLLRFLKHYPLPEEVANG